MYSQLLLLTGLLVGLIHTGESCLGGGGDGGSVPLDPYRPYITELEEDQAVFDKRLGTECVTCESEARRKLLRAGRCAAVMCDFEQVNLCKWKTKGSPGAPVPMIEKFIEENPEYAVWYASEKLKADQNRVLRRQFMARARLHRRKRQSIADTLASLQSQLGGLGGGPPLSPAEEAARNALGPVFGEPSAAAAAKAAADLQKNNKIPIDYSSLMDKIESDKTWGVYGGEFARHVTGLKQASQGDKYAVAYLYPGEWAVMSTEVTLHDEDYFIRFEGFEHNDDIRLYVACDSPDRKSLSTPIEGTNEGRRQWQTFAAKCPAGTKRLLFVCENISQTKEGACGIDDLQLFTPNGLDYCQGVDPYVADEGAAGPPVDDATEAPDFIYTPGPYPKGSPTNPPNVLGNIQDKITDAAGQALLGGGLAALGG